MTNAVVQGQGPPVLALPLPLRVGEVQNVGHLSGANDVVVAEQVPPLGINIAGAIRLVNELSAAFEGGREVRQATVSSEPERRSGRQVGPINASLPVTLSTKPLNAFE